MRTLTIAYSILTLLISAGSAHAGGGTSWRQAKRSFHHFVGKNAKKIVCDRDAWVPEKERKVTVEFLAAKEAFRFGVNADQWSLRAMEVASPLLMLSTALPKSIEGKLYLAAIGVGAALTLPYLYRSHRQSQENAMAQALNAASQAGLSVPLDTVSYLKERFDARAQKEASTISKLRGSVGMARENLDPGRAKSIREKIQRREERRSFALEQSQSLADMLQD